jgi:hypothetical protein
MLGMLALQFLTGRRRHMATTQSQQGLQHRLGQQLLRPLDEAVGLARRYRDLDAFHDYVAARWKWVGPLCLLLAVTALACGAAPLALLVGTQPAAALAGLLLAPVVLAGSLFVLLLVLFTWLEERSLARSLGRRARAAPRGLRHWLERHTGADLGRAPRVPWLLAALFVFLPLALLATIAPLTVAVLAVLLAAAPFAYARLDR